MTGEIIELDRRRPRRLTRKQFYRTIIATDPLLRGAIAEGERIEKEKQKAAKEHRQVAEQERRAEKKRRAKIEREYRRWQKEQERRRAEAYERRLWGYNGKKSLVPGRGYADPAWRTTKQRAQLIAAARADAALETVTERVTPRSWWRRLFFGDV